MIKAQDLSLQRNPTKNVFSKLPMHNSLGFFKKGIPHQWNMGGGMDLQLIYFNFELYLQVLKGRNDIHTLIQVKHNQYV